MLERKDEMTEYMRKYVPQESDEVKKWEEAKKKGLEAYIPGPWFVKPEPGTYTCEVVDGKGRLIATAYPCWACEENARLIAVAPEMFDTLEAVAPLLPEDVKEKVEALIRKAKEESEEIRKAHEEWKKRYKKEEEKDEAV
jgi:hypothetical protein